MQIIAHRLHELNLSTTTTILRSTTLYVLRRLRLVQQGCTAQPHNYNFSATPYRLLYRPMHWLQYHNHQVDPTTHTQSQRQPKEREMSNNTISITNDVSGSVVTHANGMLHCLLLVCGLSCITGHCVLMLLRVAHTFASLRLAFACGRMAAACLGIISTSSSHCVKYNTTQTIPTNTTK
jgi:hypothetical protein